MEESLLEYENNLMDQQINLQITFRQCVFESQLPESVFVNQH
jgi:hypothetical protein